MTSETHTAEEIAATLSTKARASLLRPWPRDVRKIHVSHIRYFKRNQLICQHNLTQYRLTPLGLATARAAIAKAEGRS